MFFYARCANENHLKTHEFLHSLLAAFVLGVNKLNYVCASKVRGEETNAVTLIMERWLGV